jgi:hypothetical protein
MSDDSEDDDPFASLDDPADDDPFSDLEGPTEDRESDDDGSKQLAGDAWAGEDAAESTPGDDEPWEVVDEGDEADGSGSEDEWESLGEGGSPETPSEPDDDLFKKMAGPEASTATVDEDDPFASMETPDEESGGDRLSEADEVWERLSQSDGEEISFEEKEYFEVSKHKFCEQCEHFSPPPEVNCTNQGTEIVEFLDMETVRLVNCPVVAEYRQLGDENE